MPLIAKAGEKPDKKTLLAVYRQLGARFKSAESLVTALTHSSFANENPVRPDGAAVDNNERYEFLGDAVLDLVASHLIMERFPGASEGELSRLRASIVNERRLADVARKLGIGDLLLLGKGEELSGGRNKDSLLADGFEAIVGAIYKESGFGAALRFLRKQFKPFLEELSQPGFDRDYKTRLQELSQSRLKATPRYSLVKEQGPDHDKTFEVNLSIGGQVRGVGTGKSKKEAEQAAAKSALESLEAEAGTGNGSGNGSGNGNARPTP